MNQNFARLDQAHVLRPWTNFEGKARELPTVITKGLGCTLWDEAGNQYLDAVGGLWCTNIGLGRKEMAETIAEQAEQLAFASTFVDMTNPPAAALAGQLIDRAPSGIEHVHFTTGGSEAIDSAYRMVMYAQAAKGQPQRTHCIARTHAYHGATFAAMSLGMRDGDRAPEFQYKTDTIHHVSGPSLYRRPANMTEAAYADHLIAEFEAKIAEIGAERVAAFFAEPIQASGGVLVPPDGYLRRMWEVCQKHGILFVADEVVTGFGRLGHWFASEDVFGVKPDIICCAKGLSSGYQPIGAVLFSSDIYAAMSRSDYGWYTSGFTYSGHPVACAAALKNLEIIERENLLRNASDVGAYFQDQLGTLAELPMVGDVRGQALIACVENVADKTTRAMLPDELDVGKRIAMTAQSKGLFVRPIGHLNVMSPALVLTRAQVEQIVEVLRASILQVVDDLIREGVKIS